MLLQNVIMRSETGGGFAAAGMYVCSLLDCNWSELNVTRYRIDPVFLQISMLSEYPVLSNMDVRSLILISNELPSVGNTTWVTYMMELHHWLAETEHYIETEIYSAGGEILYGKMLHN